MNDVLNKIVLNLYCDEIKEVEIIDWCLVTKNEHILESS